MLVLEYDSLCSTVYVCLCLSMYLYQKLYVCPANIPKNLLPTHFQESPKLRTLGVNAVVSHVFDF